MSRPIFFLGQLTLKCPLTRLTKSSNLFLKRIYTQTIQLFIPIVLRLVSEILSASLDVARLVSELYSTSLSLKEIMYLAIQYKDRRYFGKLPPKTELLFLCNCSFPIPRCSCFMLDLLIKSKFFCKVLRLNSFLVYDRYLLQCKPSCSIIWLIKCCLIKRNDFMHSTKELFSFNKLF